MSIKYVDLFCGIGSFHYSFQKLNWQCVMACDINEAAKQTYNENYGIMPLDDIIDINPNDIPFYDVLCAGFPCQPFSNCGKHKGFNDERGTMFFHIIKFVKHHHPKVLILENVAGLMSHDNGNTFEKIKSEIEKNGYVFEHKLLKCSEYGIPQMRQRLFIICVRHDYVSSPTLMDNLMNFTEYEKKVSLSQFMCRNFKKTNAYTIRCGGRSSPINDKHNWDGYIVDGKEYRLTIDDCLKLQGFDSTFKICGSNTQKWKQLGNTIPTIFTYIIGLNLNKYLDLTS